MNDKKAVKLTGTQKDEQWLREADPPNPYYKSIDELGTDQIEMICELKGTGSLMRDITHKVNCSLACAYAVINAHHLDYWSRKRELGQSNGHGSSLLDDLEYIQDGMTWEDSL